MRANVFVTSDLGIVLSASSELFEVATCGECDRIRNTLVRCFDSLCLLHAVNSRNGLKSGVISRSHSRKGTALNPGSPLSPFCQLCASFIGNVFYEPQAL